MSEENQGDEKSVENLSTEREKSAPVGGGVDITGAEVGVSGGSESVVSERNVYGNLGDVKKGGQHAETIHNSVTILQGNDGREKKEASEFSDPTNECSWGHREFEDSSLDSLLLEEKWDTLIQEKVLLVVGGTHELGEAAFGLWRQGEKARQGGLEFREILTAKLNGVEFAKLVENKQSIGKGERVILLISVQDRSFLDSLIKYTAGATNIVRNELRDLRIVALVPADIWNRGQDRLYRQSALSRWEFEKTSNEEAEESALEKSEQIFDANVPSRVIPLLLSFWFSELPRQSFERVVEIVLEGQEEESLSKKDVDGIALDVSSLDVFQREQRKIFKEVGIVFERRAGEGRVVLPPKGVPVENGKELFWEDSHLISDTFERMVGGGLLWDDEGGSAREIRNQIFNLAAELSCEEPKSYGVEWLGKFVRGLRRKLRSGDDDDSLLGKLLENVRMKPYVSILSGLCRSLFQSPEGEKIVIQFLGSLIEQGDHKLTLRLLSELRYVLGKDYSSWFKRLWEKGSNTVRLAAEAQLVRDIVKDPSMIEEVLSEVATWLPEGDESELSVRQKYAVCLMRRLVREVLYSYGIKGRSWKVIHEDFLEPLFKGRFGQINGRDWFHHPVLEDSLVQIRKDLGAEIEPTLKTLANDELYMCLEQLRVEPTPKDELPFCEQVLELLLSAISDTEKRDIQRALRRSGHIISEQLVSDEIDKDSRKLLRLARERLQLVLRRLTLSQSKTA